MASVEITITGTADFMKKLDALGDVLKDFRKPLNTAGERLKSYYSNEVFASQGGVYGIPWPKLSPSTVAFKSRHYRAYAAVPLVASGEMKRGFRSAAGSLQLVIDNKMKYFVYHQSSAPRRKLPRRQIMGINKDVKAIIKDELTSHLHKTIGAL